MLSEDEALLQLDRELDIRLNNLQEGKLGSSFVTNKGNSTCLNKDVPVTISRIPATADHVDNRPVASDGIKPKRNYVSPTKQNGVEKEHCNSKTVDSAERLSGTRNCKEPETAFGQENLENSIVSDVADNVCVRSVERNLGNCDTEDTEELEEAKDAIFDEFLDQSTQIRLKTLTNKVAGLTEALKVVQAECKRLADAKQEACSAAHVAEMSRRSINKQFQACQKEVARHQKSNKHSQERVKELTTECQMLRKELSGSRQSECEHRNAQSSSYAQLTRIRADNAALKEQMASLKKKHKEEVDELQNTLANSSARIKEMERRQRNQESLVKKQEQLIRVLNEQKANIGVAKAAACLEDKFLALTAPLQPP